MTPSTPPITLLARPIPIRMASNEVIEKRSQDTNENEKTSTHSSITTQTLPNNGHVDVEGAKAEFEALRRSLSRASSLHRVQSSQKDLEAPDDDDFDLLDYLRTTSAKNSEAGIKSKHIGVHWQDLEVIGSGGIRMHVRRFPDAVKEFMFTPLILALSVLPKSWNPFMPGPKNLLTGLTGVAKPGEAVLVLGRPGSGCSTFLKSIAGNRSEYIAINGDVLYSGVEAKKFLKTYKGETVYNPEGALPSLICIQNHTLTLFVFTAVPQTMFITLP